jgi:hypothetical protein
MNETGRRSSRKAEPQAQIIAHSLNGRRATVSVRGKVHVQLDVDSGEVDMMIARLQQIKVERAQAIEAQIKQQQAIVDGLRKAA